MLALGHGSRSATPREDSLDETSRPTHSFQICLAFSPPLEANNWSRSERLNVRWLEMEMEMQTLDQRAMMHVLGEIYKVEEL